MLRLFSTLVIYYGQCFYCLQDDGICYLMCMSSTLESQNITCLLHISDILMAGHEIDLNSDLVLSVGHFQFFSSQ